MNVFTNSVYDAAIVSLIGRIVAWLDADIVIGSDYNSPAVDAGSVFIIIADMYSGLCKSFG